MQDALKSIELCLNNEFLVFSELNETLKIFSTDRKGRENVEKFITHPRKSSVTYHMSFLRAREKIIFDEDSRMLARCIQKSIEERLCYLFAPVSTPTIFLCADDMNEHTQKET